ncbi:MarR family winged helix-turn-helix transcriptional regulator [Rothia sp. CCM 9417]|uniref:MarR family winged helix-turn-helix transcriptional regulator n=1 Tax=unclassified Rothia (in: high G+C Gram-positive bacteria) TaxID=2689056 RepID=UPI003ACD8494
MDRVDYIQEQWRRERPEIDLAPQSIIGRLHRLARYLTEDITAVYREYGLNEGEFDILCTLRRQGAPYEMRPADIAYGTMVTTGGTSKRLDRLEKAGLVERTSSPELDGRSKLVRLTMRGLETINRAFEAHMENEKRLVSHFSNEEREQLQSLLTLWLGRYEDLG